MLAFEEALRRKAERTPLCVEESCIVAVEAREREVNNGGYHQFFINSSNRSAPLIVAALQAIGCPRTARITADAIALLGVGERPTPEAVEEAAHRDIDALTEPLGECDGRYFDNDEPIADRLFDWIKRNRARIVIPG